MPAVVAYALWGTPGGRGWAQRFRLAKSRPSFKGFNPSAPIWPRLLLSGGVRLPHEIANAAHTLRHL